MMIRTWMPLMGMLLLAGCAGTPEGEEMPLDAEVAFVEMEDVLLDEDAVFMACSISSEGAVACALEGRAYMDEDNQVRMKYEGTFAGKPAKIELLSDGDMMQGMFNGETVFEQETPSELTEGILIGFTRMGLLHNLAKIAGGAPPDGTDGMVREWVQVSNFQGTAAEAVTFDIAVDGMHSAEGKLMFGADSVLPLERHQTVHFDGGDMTVKELYTVIKLEDDMAEKDIPSKFR